ncbi:MAG TPA: malto-oligosyltrehalose synthase, partial [Verrucomicrobiae bacterium]|nr:malto-oligosyltrehalose synthase [Verrucomicrobiae bacterium]
QTLLKITSPGVPDFYQGSEIWSYTLVDPDNRRPVDYELRMEMLRGLKEAEERRGRADLARELLLNLEDGRIKMYVTWKALTFRREQAELFASADYHPLFAVGEMARHVCAFSRRSGSGETITAVPRFLVRLLEHPSVPPVGGEVWKDFFLVLREGSEGAVYRNVFTGEKVPVVSRGNHSAIFLSDLFASFPLALLERVER